MQPKRWNLLAPTSQQMLAWAVLVVCTPSVFAETRLNPFVTDARDSTVGQRSAKVQVKPASAVVKPASAVIKPASNVTPTAKVVRQAGAIRRLRRLPPTGVSADRDQTDQPPTARRPGHLGTPTLPPASLPSTGDSRNGQQSWLQSVTATTFMQRGRQSLEDASREYSVSAWASAEASAWEALQLIAAGADMAGESQAQGETMSKRLGEAQIAIREARDFIVYAPPNRARLKSIVESHQTCVFSELEMQQATAAQAVDRYLDHARVLLTPLAGYQTEAAQAMDLIAAILLGRNDFKLLPTETALCLRRAALSGQPQNASLASRLGMQLADMGLDAEAESTLQQSMSIDPTPDVAQTLAVVRQRTRGATSPILVASTPTTSRVPKVINLSPQQFASISPAFNLPKLPPQNSAPNRSPSTLSQQPSTTPTSQERSGYSDIVGYEPPRAASSREKRKSPVGRFLDSLPKLPKIPTPLW